MDLDIFVSTNKLIAFLAACGIFAIMVVAVWLSQVWVRFRRRDD